MDKNKFYMLNFNNLNNAMQSTTERLSFSELKVFTYILKNIRFESNIITINEGTKNYIEKQYKMTDKGLCKMFTKLKKLGIIEKVKKDTYKINKDIIKYGTSNFDEGEYVKVNIANTVKVLEDAKVSLSATEIEMLLDLLTTITFRHTENNFKGNVVTFDKDTRKKFEEKYDVCSRSLDNFIKKLKDLKIVNKMANGLFQINETLIVFGGEFREVQRQNQKTIEEMFQKRREESAAFREEIQGRAIGKFFPKM